MGSTASYSHFKDVNGKYWCGECTGPDYAFWDKEDKHTNVGVEKNPFPENPDNWWTNWYLPDHPNYIGDLDKKTVDEGGTE